MATRLPGAPALEREQLLDFLYQMLLIRRFEERSAEQYGRQKIGGFLHLYIGQEAVAVGAVAALSPDDYIVSHYREHGHALARGCDPKRVMAELFGREGGVSRGKGGSMHLFDKERNFLGGYAIVAGHLPIAVGLGLSAAYKGEPRIAVAFFGDGAVNEGAFHESLNLAVVWRTPVLFICENNQYAMGTEISRVSAETQVYKRALAYNMPAEQVDGMDVVAVYEATKRLADRARAGEGPMFLEAMTYRFRGHSMADPELYRSKEETQRWLGRDPIARLKDRMENAGLLSNEEFTDLDQKARAVVDEAVRWADESPPPPPEALWTDVYVNRGPLRGRDHA